MILRTSGAANQSVECICDAPHDRIPDHIQGRVSESDRRDDVWLVNSGAEKNDVCCSKAEADDRGKDLRDEHFQYCANALLKGFAFQFNI